MLVFLSNSFDEKRWVCCRNKPKEPEQAKIYKSTWNRRTRTRTPRTHARTHETADATDTEAGAPGRSSTPLAEPLSVSGALRNLASAQSAAYANVSAAYAALAAALASDQNGAARGDTRGSLLESAILLAANAAPSVPLHSSLPLHSSFPMHPSFPPQPPHSSIPRPALVLDLKSDRPPCNAAFAVQTHLMVMSILKGTCWRCHDHSQDLLSFSEGRAVSQKLRRLHTTQALMCTARSAPGQIASFAWNGLFIHGRNTLSKTAVIFKG